MRNITNRQIILEFPPEILQEVRRSLECSPERKNDFQWILNECISRCEASQVKMDIKELLIKHGFGDISRRVKSGPRKPYKYEPVNRLTQTQAELEISKIKEHEPRSIQLLGKTIALQMQEKLISQINLRVIE